MFDWGTTIQKMYAQERLREILDEMNALTGWILSDEEHLRYMSLCEEEDRILARFPDLA